MSGPRSTAVMLTASRSRASLNDSGCHATPCDAPCRSAPRPPITDGGAARSPTTSTHGSAICYSRPRTCRSPRWADASAGSDHAPFSRARFRKSAANSTPWSPIPTGSGRALRSRRRVSSGGARNCASCGHCSGNSDSSASWAPEASARHGCAYRPLTSSAAPSPTAFVSSNSRRCAARACSPRRCVTHWHLIIGTRTIIHRRIR